MKPIHWMLVMGSAVLVGAMFFLQRTWMTSSNLQERGDSEINGSIMPGEPRNQPVTLRIAGELAALKEVDVASPLAGRVSQIRFKTGEHVNANAVVAVVQPDGLMEMIAGIEAALRTAQTDSAKMKEQLAGAELELARAEELLRQDLIARHDVDKAISQVDLARAQLQLAEARMAQQKALLAQARAVERRTRLMASMAGVVVQRWVEIGAAVTESTAIVRIADVNTLKLISRIPERNATELHVGMTVRLTTPDAPGKTFLGKIARVARDSSPLNDTEVEVHVAPDGGLRPGSMIEATIEANNRGDGS